MSTLLVLLSVICTATCTIYNVTPDDTTCHHCHNLQHYLLNTTKYFTSNTQLLFLPGLHHLHTSLIIQNVHNISLIGNPTNDTTPDTVIQCDSSVGIAMYNITSLTIKKVVIKNCTVGHDFLTKSYIALLIAQCTYVQLYCVQIRHTKISSIRGINIFGDLHLTNITCDTISLHYNETRNGTYDHTDITVIIDNLHDTNTSKLFRIALLKFETCFNNLTLQVANTHVAIGNKDLFLNSYIVSAADNYDKISVTNCQFYGRTLNEEAGTLFSIAVSTFTSIYFSNCLFHLPLQISGAIDILGGLCLDINQCNFHSSEIPDAYGLISSTNCALVNIKNSNFYFNSVQLLKISQLQDHQETQIIIQNTTFSNNKITYDSLICITNSNLILMGPVIFHRNLHADKITIEHKTIEIITEYKTIFELHNSNISANGYIEFSNNSMVSIIYHICRKRLDCFFFNILGSMIINITSNTLSTYFTAEGTKPSSQKINYPMCYFQYYNVRDYNYCILKEKTSIIFYSNEYKSYLKDIFLLKELLFLIINYTPLIAIG